MCKPERAEANASSFPRIGSSFLTVRARAAVSGVSGGETRKGTVVSGITDAIRAPAVLSGEKGSWARERGAGISDVRYNRWPL